jgi:cytochrome b561
MAMKIDEGEMSTYVYTRTSRALHWLMVFFIFGMLGLGWFMMSIEDDPGSDWYFMIHKSIGLIVLLLALVRLLWRLAHTPDPLPEQLPRWQVRASKITQWLLYGLMFAMPLAGLTGALFSKDRVSFFGARVPKILAANHDLSEIFFSMHSVIAWVFVGLISLHFLAGLKHLLINRDGVFQRMWIQSK